MEKTQVTLLKAAFTRLANERIEKWERLDNEEMVTQAKADATTGFAMLCNAIDAVQLVTQEPMNSDEAYIDAYTAGFKDNEATDEDIADLRRYRWLRDSGDLPRVVIEGRWYGNQHRATLDLDAAIDAAMQAGK